MKIIPFVFELMQVVDEKDNSYAFGSMDDCLDFMIR